jgi:hypothetical protein
VIGDNYRQHASRPGWCVKRTQGFILVRAKITLRLVDSTVARVALHKSARSRGYKLLREETDHRSLRGCCVSEVCPCLPFYSFQGEGSGYICGKKVKWGKDEKEKQKRWPRAWQSSSLSGVSSFSCSAETLWALSFWPLHPLVQHVVAMPRPVCFCAVEDGRYVRLDLRRERGRWYSCRYLHRYRGMDVVVME